MNETQNQDNQKTQDNFKKSVSLTEIDDKVGFCVVNVLKSADAADLLYYNHFFIAPFPCEVKKVMVTHSTAPAGNCRIQLQKLTSGTASPSGSATFNIMASNLRLDTLTINTPTTVEYPNLTRSSNACVLKEGDRLGVYVDAGSPVGMRDLLITVYLTPTGRGHYI